MCPPAWSRSTWACELKLIFSKTEPYSQLSRSTWACELKYVSYYNLRLHLLSRSTWACELKFTNHFISNFVQSHAPRERVSWNLLVALYQGYMYCHAPRERVSWNYFVNYFIHCLLRHAPRERVSWNSIKTAEAAEWHTSRSTWACELKLPISTIFDRSSLVTLHVSVWVEIKPCGAPAICSPGHAPRERVSWNQIQ